MLYGGKRGKHAAKRQPGSRRRREFTLRGFGENGADGSLSRAGCGLSLRDLTLDAAAILLGSALFGASVNVFAMGNQIVSGGATGLSILANHLFGTPVGMTVVLINIPLFLLALRRMGKLFFVKTAAATLVSSLAIDLFSFLPHYADDRLLAAIFGGVTHGIGLSLIYLRGIMTGGSDLLSALIRRRFSGVSLGHLLLAVDGAIVLLASCVYGDVTSAFYSAILIYASSTVIDAVLAGTEQSRFCFIISEEKETIERRIIETLDRSATSFSGRGAYGGREKNIILCAVKRFEVYRLRKIVSDADPNAFIIFGNAAEVFGVGFTRLKR